MTTYAHAKILLYKDEKRQESCENIFILGITNTMWKSIMTGWNNKVYLDILLPKWIEFTIEILMDFISFCTSAVSLEKKDDVPPCLPYNTDIVLLIQDIHRVKKEIECTLRPLLLKHVSIYVTSSHIQLVQQMLQEVTIISTLNIICIDNEIYNK